MDHHPMWRARRQSLSPSRNHTSTEAARLLAEKGLFLSHGDFYAWTVVQRFGLEPEGFIRAGCACYTTEEEIDRLLQCVDEIRQ